MTFALALACGCLLAPLLAPRAPQAGGTRTPLAQVELEGPLSEVELSFADGSGTTLAIDLRAGERRTLTVPVPPPPGAPDARPAVTLAGAGAARFTSWVGDDREQLAAEWARLPLGLRQRPRPPAPEQPLDPGPPLPALLVACAAFLLALRWRRRGGVALAVGLLGAGAAYALAVGPAPVGAELSLLEGDGASGAWVSMRVARDRLQVPPSEPLRVQTRPPRAVLRARVEEGPAGLLCFLQAPGASIDQLELAPIRPDALTRAGANRLGGLAAVWLREPDGTWTPRGAWPLDEPLPAALPGAGEPPGWINPALPMGVGILIGRRAPEGGSTAGAWVRVVGF